jgi:tagatose-1,6-bisphosphate aldolase non-catalytic subunit AgaZ/GatZ
VHARLTPAVLFLLFEAGCTDYQDDRAFPVLAQAAENLMHVGSDSTDDDAE